jgi:hypothetical protein
MIKYLLITNNNKIIIPKPEYVYQTFCEAAKKPNIYSLSIKTGRQDSIPFHERNCIRNSISTIYSKEPIFLVRTHAFKSDKYGA